MLNQKLALRYVKEELGLSSAYAFHFATFFDIVYAHLFEVKRNGSGTILKIIQFVWKIDFDL